MSAKPLLLLALASIIGLAQPGHIAAQPNTDELLNGRGQYANDVTVDVAGKYPIPARNLSEAEQKRLRVVWDRPMRQINADIPHWSTITVSGKLSLADRDGESSKLVDWRLPLRVLVCPRPSEKPGWSKLHERRNAIWRDVFVGRELLYGWRTLANGTIEPVARGVTPAGMFTATFPLSDLEKPTGPMSRFQLGLCVGFNKGGKRVTWRNKTPVLSQTVQMIEIARPALSPTLRLIDACPGPTASNYDPIALVRAGNHLRSLGKEKAISALRDFLEIVYDRAAQATKPDTAMEIDASKRSCLAALLPVVFENLETKDIEIWEDIPFHIPPPTRDRIGHVTLTQELVDRAAIRGTLRQKPLRPADNPLESADSLFEKIATAQDRKQGTATGGLRYSLRKQAWKAVGHVLEPADSFGVQIESQKVWADLKARAVRVKLRWDEERQEFRIGDR